MSNVGRLNDQVDEVKGIVRSNIDKVVARGEKIDDLGDRAEYLQNEATQFEKTAVRARRTKQCQHAKLWIILVAIIAVILFVIIIIAIILGVVLNR